MISLKKILYVIAGSVALTLGVIGIFVPGLPTTPFLLLSAALYLRGSEKMYNKLINHKYLGKYIRNYRENKCMKIMTKIYAILLMWTMISVSCIYFIENSIVKIIVLSVGFIGTIVMGFVVKTCGRVK